MPKPLKSVAVIGLFSKQWQRLETKAPKNLELIFVDKEQSATVIPPSTFIIIQRHSRHRWYYKAREQCPSSNVFFAHGGVSSVLRTLKQIEKV